MSTLLPKTYDFKKREEYWRKFWERENIYRFDKNWSPDPGLSPGQAFSRRLSLPKGRTLVETQHCCVSTKKIPKQIDDRIIFSVDTPPPYVSASHLHVGHIMSYSQAEFIVRYKRMQGYRVFYPIGFDDNGLPTERFVEQKYKVDKSKISRSDFIKLCLKETKLGAQTYKNLWRLLGISVDWTKTYSTIDKHSQRISQWSFIDLYKKGKIIRREGPIAWCPHCQTALAQADLEDKQEKGFLNYIEFTIPLPFLPPLKEGRKLVIATTRPELLGACVALYYHPQDKRYQRLKGKKAMVPLFNYQVPILTNKTVDPKFGTGLMMVCTFGDKDDIAKWQKDKLATRALFDRKGRITSLGKPYQGLTIKQAREKIIGDLKKQGYFKNQEPIEHTLNVHERCSTPAEFIQTKQWFIKLLNAKKEFLKRGRQLKWHPEYMRQKYEDWVHNLNWDWCISRQRYYGVPFPVWYCNQCQEPILAQEQDLPVDPTEDKPSVKKCPKCGYNKFKPENDVMDTWATSSLTPVIISAISNNKTLSAATPDRELYPSTLRPQAFEIIRTWLFYTVVKSHYHHNHLPFRDVMISGHGLDAQGRKISKRLGNFKNPEKIIDQYGADALRYWATGATLGENLRYNEDEVKKGKRTVTKIFNAARFALMHLCHSEHSEESQLDSTVHNYPRDPSVATLHQYDKTDLEPADKWILHHLNQAIKQTTDFFDNYEYAKARNIIDNFFWHITADNYLEFIKYRLYGKDKRSAKTAQQTLFTVMLNTLKLYAPILPFITEEIYQGYFKQFKKQKSIHISLWPKPQKSWRQSKKFLNEFDKVLNLINNIRKYKSEKNLSLGAEISEFRATEKVPKKYLDFIQQASRVKKIIF